MVRIVTDDDIASVLSLSELLPVIETAFIKQGQGQVERPDRPHFPIGQGLDDTAPDHPFGTALTMPAYLHGAETAATKLVTVHEGNPSRNLPTVHAQIALTDAKTGQSTAFMAGTRITNARTACVGGLAARELTDPPITLGVIGARTQARWQSRAITTAVAVDAIRVYAPSDSKYDCATDLETELGVTTTPTETPGDAVAGADMVVTTTTASDPVFPGDRLDPGTVVVAVGAYNSEMQELDTATMSRASRIFADVPAEAATTGDVQNTGVDPDMIQPFSDLFTAAASQRSDEEIIVVLCVGTAVMDAAAGEHVYQKAVDAGKGTTIDLS